MDFDKLSNLEQKLLMLKVLVMRLEVTKKDKLALGWAPDVDTLQRVPIDANRVCPRELTLAEAGEQLHKLAHELFPPHHAVKE